MIAASSFLSIPSETRAILKKIEKILVPKYANIVPGWADDEYKKVKEDPWNSMKASQRISSLISQFHEDIGGKIDRPTVPETNS